MFNHYFLVACMCHMIKMFRYCIYKIKYKFKLNISDLKKCNIKNIWDVYPSHEMSVLGPRFGVFLEGGKVCVLARSAGTQTLPGCGLRLFVLLSSCMWSPRTRAALSRRRCERVPVGFSQKDPRGGSLPSAQPGCPWAGWRRPRGSLGRQSSRRSPAPWSEGPRTWSKTRMGFTSLCWHLFW